MIVKNKYYLILAGIFVLLLFLSLNLNDKMKLDEFYNHIPTLVNLKNYNLLEVLKGEKYRAANGPVPYLINLPFILLSDDKHSLTLAKIITSIFGYLSLIIVFNIFLGKYRLTPELSFLYSLIILFYPYFLKPSFTFYMAIYGLFFYLASVYLLMYNDESLKNLFLAGVFLGLATLSQQYYLPILGAYFFYFILIDNGARILRINSKFIIKLLFVLLPPAILILMILILWKGLVPTHFRFHEIKLDRFNITLILTAIGTFLLPVTMLNLKNYKRYLLRIFLVALLLALLNFPKFSIVGGYGLATGLSFNFINIFENKIFFLGLLLKIVFITSGLIVLLEILSNLRHDKLKKLLSLCFIFLFIGYVFNTILAERHLLPLIVISYLLLLPSIKNQKYIVFYSILQILIGSIYYYYYLYIQPSY